MKKTEFIKDTCTMYVDYKNPFSVSTYQKGWQAVSPPGKEEADSDFKYLKKIVRLACLQSTHIANAAFDYLKASDNVGNRGRRTRHRMGLKPIKPYLNSLQIKAYA